MTPIQAMQPFHLDGSEGGSRIKPVVNWTVKERVDGLWVAKAQFKNLITNAGLTALALAPGGNYLAPTYLVIDQSYTTMSAASSGATSVVLAADPTISGDTQLVLSVGLSAQETVTFSAKSGTGPFTFTVSALANNHAASDPCVRAPTVADTMSSVVSEAQYDSTNAPNMRVPSSGSYSPGTGQGTMQFFISGSTATNIFFAHVGMADKQSMTDATTNLHNYAALGYNHNNTNDLEIDVVYTLQIY